MEVKIKVKRMHRRINNSAHCRLGKFFFGNLKWIVPEDKVSHLRARKNNRGAHKRERGENSSRGAGRRERGTSVPDSTCLGTFSTGHLFLFVSPIGPWAPKRLPRSCLSFISSASSTGGAEVWKHLRSIYWVQTLHREAESPRDRAWVTERVRLELLDCYWAALGWCRYIAWLDFTLFAFKWGCLPDLSRVLWWQKTPSQLQYCATWLS